MNVPSEDDRRYPFLNRYKAINDSPGNMMTSYDLQTIWVQFSRVPPRPITYKDGKIRQKKFTTGNEDENQYPGCR